ncbi:MAG: TPM domain-containing protein [Bacteroidetes bacterium]|nr:TPM domain-containing protein [Bacteroidota bacterium]
MKNSLTFLILIFTVQISFGQLEKPKNFKFPDYAGYVNDFEGIFTDQQIVELDSIIAKHEKETSNEIAVVTIDSISPYSSLFDYSLDLANSWGIGKKDRDNGVLLIFGKTIRQIQIQVGYGLEDKLKDPEAKKIIDEFIIPEFRKGEFYEGIKIGVLKVINEIK